MLLDPPPSYGTSTPRRSFEPPTALRSGAHDGYKPSALPVELWAQLACPRNRFPLFRDMREMVRVVGFEPTASCVRGRHSRRAELHPVETSKRRLAVINADRAPRSVAAYCQYVGRSVDFDRRRYPAYQEGQLMAKRTTHRSSKGTKLYAVRDKTGKFKDIQTYKRAHGSDVKRKSKAESAKKK